MLRVQDGHIKTQRVLHDHTHMVHVWYIYLHLVDSYAKCKGNIWKYTIHGLFGIGFPPRQDENRNSTS